jgi:TRAP-type C4-dicarboxylate transport system permease small subunit
MVNKLARIAGYVERAITVVAAVLMAALALLVCWQVFARYVLHASPFWVEEITVTAMMWIGLLGGAACVWTGSHMSLELLVRRLPLRVRAVVEICGELAITAFAGFLGANGWRLAAVTMSSRMSTVPLPLGLTYVVIPLAAALMIVLALVRVVTKGAVLLGKGSGDAHG